MLNISKMIMIMTMTTIAITANAQGQAAWNRILKNIQPKGLNLRNRIIAAIGQWFGLRTNINKIKNNLKWNWRKQIQIIFYTKKIVLENDILKYS